MDALNERISRLIDREVFQYLVCESDWQPFVEKTLLPDGARQMKFSYPSIAYVPSITVTVSEASE